MTIQLQSSLTSYRTEADSLTSRLVTLESALQTNTAGLMTFVTDGATAIAALQDTVGALDTKMTNQMDAAQAAFSTLKSEVAALTMKTTTTCQKVRFLFGNGSHAFPSMVPF